MNKKDSSLQSFYFSRSNILCMRQIWFFNQGFSYRFGYICVPKTLFLFVKRGDGPIFKKGDCSIINEFR